MRAHPRRQAREAGAGPVLVMMVLAVLALLAGLVLTGKFAVAGDERSAARNAADAAALAGAQGVLDEIPVDLAPGFLTPTEIPVLLGGSGCTQTGRVQASQLAAQNGGTLTSYCYDVYDDEVHTSVRMNSSQVGAPGSADATAATTFEATGCNVAASFHLPTTAPSPTGDDSPPPVPADVTTSFDCGINPLPVVFDPITARFHFVGLEAILREVDPRLTS